MTGWSRGACRGTGVAGRGGGRGGGFCRRRGIAEVPSKEVAGAATVSVEKAETTELESLNREVQDVAALLQTITEKIARWKKEGDNRSL